MISPLPCAAADLLPHRGKMLLLRSLEEWGDQRAAASAATDDAQFFRNSRGQTGGVALIEMAAQTVFAWTKWRDRASSAPQVTGFLAGLRDVRLLDSPRPEEALRVRCREVLRISGSAVVETEIHGEERLLATGRILLVETDEMIPPSAPISPLPSRDSTSLPLLSARTPNAYSTRSPLSQALLDSLNYFAPAKGEGAVLARFGFCPEFPAFEGHFPGRPILPGVVLLEAARLACELEVARPLELAEVKRAKFLWPVEPESELAFAIHAEEGDLRAHVQVSLGARPVAELSLSFRDRGPGAPPS